MDIPQYLNRAQSALKEGEFDLATRYFQQILHRYPNHPEALQGMKDITVALAKKRFPPWIREIKLWGLLLSVALGRAQQSLADLDLLYHCQPDHLRTAMAYGRCLEKLERFDEAHGIYDRILDQNATHLQALSADAELLVKLDRLDEAAARFQRLLAMKPNDDRLTHRLRDISARSYARVGIPENLQARRAAIEKEKRDAPAPPEVMEELEKKLLSYKKNPADKELGVQIAAHYRKAELFDSANHMLATILDKDPHYPPARREQARVWFQSGELHIAENLYKELLSVSPQDRELRDECLNTTVALLERQCAENRNDHHALSLLERVKIERDQNRTDFLQNYIADHPEAFEERIELANLYLRRGRSEDAVPVLQRVIHEPSYAGKGFFLLGQCFRAKGDVSLAVQQFQKALDFFKNKGYSHIPSQDLKLIYYYMGLAKEELGDKSGAKEAYGEVYSADINFMDVRKRYENLFT